MLLGLSGALGARSAASPVLKALSLAGAAFVLVLEVATLVDYPGLSHLDVAELIPHAESLPPSGRSSPPTALSLLATAVMLMQVRGRSRPSEWLILATAATAFASLMGLALGAGPLYQLTRAPIFASLPTALALLLICSGMLLERPAADAIGAVTSRGLGGVLFRRF